MGKLLGFKPPKYFFSFSRPDYFYVGRYRLVAASDNSPFNRGWSQGCGLFVLKCRWNADRSVASDGIHYPERNLILVNGDEVLWQAPVIAFETVCALAGESRYASVMYSKGPAGKPTGILARGDTVRIVSGMDFSAVVTGSA